MPFPRPPGAQEFWCPGKDAVADYLADYAQRFALPLSSGCRVDALGREGDVYVATTSAGELRARAAIIATGAHQRAAVPALAERLAPEIRQLHATEYRRPEELTEGPVLVVGAGASGAEIALELARSGKEVTLAGPDVPHLPGTIAGRDLYWWLYATRVIRARCDRPPGSWICHHSAGGGDQLVGISRRDFARAGIRRIGWVTQVREGRPAADGAGVPVAATTVIWCTGYEPAFDRWLRLPVLDEGGGIRQRRGVVAGEPALFTVGLPFQAHPDSGLLGGAGVDAAFVAERIRTVLG